MNLKNKTNDQLNFIVKDCSKAIQAMPTNPKCFRYLQSMRAAENELTRRARITLARKDLNGHLFDPLGRTQNPTTRKRYRARKQISARNRNPYDIDRYRTACFQIGWYRKYDLI